MAEHFKVDVFALHHAMEIGAHMERVRDHLARAVRDDSPEGARFESYLARKECRNIIQTLQMLEWYFRNEIPKEKPQLREAHPVPFRAVGENH